MEGSADLSVQLSVARTVAVGQTVYSISSLSSLSLHASTHRLGQISNHPHQPS